MKRNLSPEQFEHLREKAQKISRKLKELFPKAHIALNFGNNFELLVAVVLSAQCTDKKVNEVTEKLFKKYRSVDDYARASEDEFEQDIKATGFFRNKAKNIITTAKIIQEKYNGLVPKSMEELLELPGVGRKTANIILGNAFGIVEGIAVDTHVRRLSQVLGLTDESDPDKIEQDLMKLIDKKDWFYFTYELIDYGRKFCPAKKHDHSNCPLKDFYVKN